MNADKISRKKKNGNLGKREKPFEEKLAKFLMESEERLFDLRKNIETKRGRKRR